MAEPQDPAAAGRGLMRASHADREQVIEALKGAFVHGRLTRDELDTQLGWAPAARTHADLAALTADIPPAPAAPARRRPLASAAAGSGGCLAIAFGAMKLIGLADPGATPGPIPKALGGPLFILFVAAVITALAILGHGVAAAVDQRRSRRPPPRQRPGGHALEYGPSSGTGHGPVPPAPAPTRPVPTCGLTSHGRVGAPPPAPATPPPPRPIRCSCAAGNGRQRAAALRFLHHARGRCRL